MAAETAVDRAPQDSSILKLKNLEVILIDGLLIAGALLLDRLNMWERLDLPLKTADDIERARLGHPLFIPVLALAAAVVLVYAMARKSKPENPMLQAFYGSGLMGIMWTCAGITTLLFNSVIMSLPGLLLGYIVALKHESGDIGLFASVNRIYDHPSRIIILPAAVYIYASGMEYLMLTGMSPAFAMICTLMLYLPVRIMLMFKEPYRWYHFISMTAAFAVFAHSAFVMINSSPAVPVWTKIGGYLGDRVRVIEESGGSAVVYSNVARSMGSYSGVNFFNVTKTATGKWEVTKVMDSWEYIESLEAGAVKALHGNR